VKVNSEEITLDAVNELTIKVGKRKFKKVIFENES